MTLLTVFYYFAIVFGFIFLVWNAMAFFGGDADTDGLDDVDVSGDGLMGEALTFRSMINFITFFAWFGVFFLEQGLNYYSAVGYAALCGLVMTIIFASIMFGFRKLQATPKDIDKDDVVNQTATVYLVIPGKDMKGKIQISLVRGGLRTIDAISQTGEKIDTNSQVVVTEFISDNLVKVSKIN